MQTRAEILLDNVETLLSRLRQNVIPTFVVQDIQNKIERMDISLLDDKEKIFFNEIQEIIHCINQHKQKSRFSFSLFSDKQRSTLRTITDSEQNPFTIDEVIYHFAKLVNLSDRRKFRLISKQWKANIDFLKMENEYFYPDATGQLIIKSNGLSSKKLFKTVAEFSKREGKQTAAALREIITEDLKECHEDFYSFIKNHGMKFFYSWAACTFVFFFAFMYMSHNDDKNWLELLHPKTFVLAAPSFIIVKAMTLLNWISPAAFKFLFNLFRIDNLQYFLPALIICTALAYLTEFISRPFLKIPGYCAEKNTLRFFKQAEENYEQYEKEESDRAQSETLCTRKISMA